MSYTSGSHTVFHHRYHIVWITKYRYKVLEGALRERIRTIIRQVCKELGVQIVSGVLSREHVHIFVEIPPHIAVSDFVRRVKGRSSHRVQMEFPDLRKRNWGGISGPGATSPPRAATSRTMSYFSIFGGTNLPASAGSYSVASAARGSDLPRVTTAHILEQMIEVYAGAMKPGQSGEEGNEIRRGPSSHAAGFIQGLMA